MKKFFCALMGAALAAALLAGCGGSGSSSAPAASAPASQPASEPASAPADSAPAEAADTASLDAIVAAIEAANPVQDPYVYTDLDADFGGVTVDNVVAFSGKETKVGTDSALILALQVKDGTADAVKAELEAKKGEYSSNLYAEFADKVAKAQDARVASSGNFVVFVIGGLASDYAAIDEAINTALAQ